MTQSLLVGNSVNGPNDRLLYPSRHSYRLVYPQPKRTIPTSATKEYYQGNVICSGIRFTVFSFVQILLSYPFIALYIVSFTFLEYFGQRCLMSYFWVEHEFFVLIQLLARNWAIMKEEVQLNNLKTTWTSCVAFPMVCQKPATKYNNADIKGILSLKSIIVTRIWSGSGPDKISFSFQKSLSFNCSFFYNMY